MRGLGLSSKAIPLLTKRANLKPEDRETQRVLVIALHEVGRVAEAATLRESVVKADLSDGESRYFLGVFGYFRGSTRRDWRRRTRWHAPPSRQPERQDLPLHLSG